MENFEKGDIVEVKGTTGKYLACVDWIDNEMVGISYLPIIQSDLLDENLDIDVVQKTQLTIVQKRGGR